MHERFFQFRQETVYVEDGRRFWKGSQRFESKQPMLSMDDVWLPRAGARVAQKMHAFFREGLGQLSELSAVNGSLVPKGLEDGCCFQNEQLRTTSMNQTVLREEDSQRVFTPVLPVAQSEYTREWRSTVQDKVVR